MKSIYIKSETAEKEAKRRFNIPEFLMMENAAASLESSVLEFLWKGKAVEKNGAGDGVPLGSKVLVLCGMGNNGGDGYALARRLCGKVSFVAVVPFGLPKTEEAARQSEMCRLSGVPFMETAAVDSLSYSVIVDCIYGTGFHSELPENVRHIVEWCNKQKGYRIACDIPSGIDLKGNISTKDENKNPVAFCADETVTMGALKLALFSDFAKDFTGKVKVADLGLSSKIFESCAVPDAYFLEEKDIKLPYREKKSVHKGNFGHAAVALGEKPGAGIIAGTAALRFGAGLVSLVNGNLCSQAFEMSPELMFGNDFPERTTAVLLGSGLGRSAGSFAFGSRVIDFILNMKKSAAVLDADFFYREDLYSVLKDLNDINGGLAANVILTPHPKELCELISRTKIRLADDPEVDSKIDMKNGGLIPLNKVLENRLEYCLAFEKEFPNLTLVSKGADTFIFSKGKVFVCCEGTNALAKAGSGDVLAGLCLSLLAQGYTAEEAAKTAVFAHGKAGSLFEKNYSCTPLSLIENAGGILESGFENGNLFYENEEESQDE